MTVSTIDHVGRNETAVLRLIPCSSSRIGHCMSPTLFGRTGHCRSLIRVTDMLTTVRSRSGLLAWFAFHSREEDT